MTQPIERRKQHGVSHLLPPRPRTAFPPCCHVVIQAEAEDRDAAQRVAEQLWREYDL